MCVCVVRQVDVRIAINTDILNKNGHCWAIQDGHDRKKLQKQRKETVSKFVSQTVQKKAESFNHTACTSLSVPTLRSLQDRKCLSA